MNRTQPPRAGEKQISRSNNRTKSSGFPAGHTAENPSPSAASPNVSKAPDVIPTLVPGNPRRSYKPKLNVDKPPPRVDRQAGADLLFAVLGFRVSPRTLETWPLATKIVNGRATSDTAELLALARSKMEAAPTVRGGRKRNAA